MSAQWLVVLALIFMTAASPAVAQNTSPPDPAAALDPAAAQPDDVHPQPAHTGWATLVKDTGRDFLAFPKRRSTKMRR